MAYPVPLSADTGKAASVSNLIRNNAYDIEECARAVSKKLVRVVLTLEDPTCTGQNSLCVWNH
jgi:phage terminase large subunit-like protein